MGQDERIRNDIQEELDWDPSIKSTDIGVIVKNGAVRLTGTVNTFAERLAAENAAKRVSGVHAIAEDVDVTPHSGNVDQDEEIARRISNVLEWNVMVPEPNVQAEVRNGFVTLTGQVEWNFEREAIKNQIAPLKGVRGINNQIELHKRVSEKDVSKNIARALHRNADLEKSNVSVDVDGGKVTITGNVKAYYEKELIENAVWAAPGVVEVVDELRIN